MLGVSHHPAMKPESHRARSPSIPPTVAPTKALSEEFPTPALRPSVGWAVGPRLYWAAPRSPARVLEAPACFYHVCEKSPWAAGRPQGGGASRQPESLEGQWRVTRTQWAN